MKQVKELRKILSENDALPFLFVGSGISRRYLGLPDWEGLLRSVANLISDDDFFFHKIKRKSQVESGDEGNYNRLMTTLCDNLSAELDAVWFTDDKFSDSRKICRDLDFDNGLSPIKFEISNLISKQRKIKDGYKEEIEKLKLLNENSIAGIITTNYDCLLEDVFEFETYSSQDELLFSQSYNIAEIYKIHGCVKTPSSILINSSDYELIRLKNKYIAAKLLTIFVEHPVIFMGYSLQDEDIQGVLEEIGNCLNTEQLAKLSSRLIFIKWAEGQNKVQVKKVLIKLNSNRTIEATEISADSFVKIFETIHSNRTQLPVAAIRKLKKFMYSLSISQEASEKIYVQDVDKILNDEDFQVAVGFGKFPDVNSMSDHGYVSITAAEIYFEMILNDRNWDNLRIAEKTIPGVARGVGYSLPFYKYIQDISPLSLPPEIQKMLLSNLNYDSYIPKSRKGYVIGEGSVKEIISRYPNNVKKQISEIPFLRDKLDKDDLHAFIEKILLEDKTFYLDHKMGARSSINKIIRIWDFLEYGESYCLKYSDEIKKINIDL